jgi:NAD(P)-dependent dehydrogenase (short-subunit alcohol dehydrogenase family)
MSEVMLVTGASRGIGAATARLAAARGFAVAVNYRPAVRRPRPVVNEIAGAGGRAIAVQGDVAVEADVKRLFETVDGELGTLGVLINNAGILETAMRLDEMTVERWQRVLATNVVGSFLCAREAVRRMSTRHGGSGGTIVNVSSAASRLGGPGEFIDYAASKGAIDAMTIGLSKEVAREGIRVNAVRPGLIETEIHASGGQPDRVERLKDAVPMGRGGTPEEVAEAILWLASEPSRPTSPACSSTSPPAGD